MKRSIALLLAVILMFSLGACGKNQQDSSSDSDVSADTQTGTTLEENNPEDDSIDSGAAASNVLIAYFSIPEDVETNGVDAVAGASIVVRDDEKLGNTEYVAKLIQETIGGDLFRIETVDPYPLEHDALVDQAAGEQDAGLFIPGGV